MVVISPVSIHAYILVSFALILGACDRDQGEVTHDREILTSIADTAFLQEYHQGYAIAGERGSHEVRSIAVDNEGTVWIATSSGVFTRKPGEQNWSDAIPKAFQGPSFAVEKDGESVWISTWNSLYRFKENKLQPMQGVEAPVSLLCVAKEGVYALGPSGVWLSRGHDFTKVEYNIARSVRDVTADNKNGLWVGTDVGLYHCTPEATKHFTGNDGLVSAYVRGVATDGDKVWAGGLGGVSILRAGNKIETLQTNDGIPSVHVNCVERSPDGVMWVGTNVGVVRYYPDGSHSLLFSRRWLLDDKVNDIAFDQHGNAWIATDGGVSVIRRKKMTLATKQQYFYDVLMRRHIRDPWIAGQCRLAVAGDTTTWTPEDDDNDGEYTGNYLAMESFRYAVTRSDDAKVKAKKAFQFLKFLQEVTETDGFFARTIVPATWEEVHDGNRIYTERELADELVKEPRFKPVTERWRKSSDGKWKWKGDTSSDEICGHMFGYFIYYELVADDEEKKVIARHVRKIVDHLMVNNFTLTDKDGKPTRWGVWSPDRLNDDPEWLPDRSLNSMELLSFIKLAYYMTDDGKYQQEYLRLINEEKYLDNMANIPNQDPAWFIYFDVMLAAYQYPILLKCEKDPALRLFYEQHIDNWIEKRKHDQNPLINFIYCFSRNKKVEIQSSVDFLKNTPLDLIDWTIDHSKREDVTLVRRPVLDEVQVDELQPASIRATIRWDKNPWSATAGNHHVEREPVFWLLPYWMGRYLEMIN